MKSKNHRFYTIPISLLFLSISSASLTQASDDYPMMGRGEHRSMMGYGYGQGRYAEDTDDYDAMPYGRRGMGGAGCDQMNPGMRHGHMGSGMKRSLQAIMQLDLSDSQKQQVREIHRKHRRENWNRMGEMMDHQDKLEELYDADIPDPKAIGKVYAVIFEIQRKKIESSIQAQNKIRTLLDSKQQEALDKELKSSKQYRHGYGYRH